MKDVTILKNAGIDVDAGLAYLGDMSLYDEMLLEFKNGFINQMNDIKVKYETKDFANYVILVHALKSNCKTFGIMNLSNLAYNHEMKGKENDINYINEHINELFVEANNVLQVLNNYFN